MIRRGYYRFYSYVTSSSSLQLRFAPIEIRKLYECDEATLWKHIEHIYEKVLLILLGICQQLKVILHQW